MGELARQIRCPRCVILKKTCAQSIACSACVCHGLQELADAQDSVLMPMSYHHPAAEASEAMDADGTYQASFYDEHGYHRQPAADMVSTQPFCS